MNILLLLFSFLRLSFFYCTAIRPTTLSVSCMVPWCL